MICPAKGQTAKHRENKPIETSYQKIRRN